MKSLIAVAWIVAASPALAMTAALAQAPASQAGVNCASAEGPVEKLICSNSALTMLDSESTRLFILARDDAGSNRNAVIASQNAWIKRRDNCASSTDKERCITESYVQRIAVLLHDYPAVLIAKTGTNIGPFIATCEGSSRPVHVTFINSNPSFVHVTDGNVSVVLKQALSGSGARYEAQFPKGQARLWNKGNTAQIALPGGKDMNCTLKPVSY